MRDPVMDAQGHTFERSAIERSLVYRPHGDARLTLDRAACSMIDAFDKAAGELVACELAR
jgi:hypothetical protein